MLDESLPGLQQHPEPPMGNVVLPHLFFSQYLWEPGAFCGQERDLLALCPEPKHGGSASTSFSYTAYNVFPIARVECKSDAFRNLLPGRVSTLFSFLAQDQTALR